jgi:dTMP kinase
MAGRFIVLEGPDGSGTTTHAALLAEYFTKKGEDVLLTCEPTKGPIGAFIREQLATKTMTPEALQLLFTADRAWHVEHDIAPALHDGKTIICDRYWLSTVVYAAALGINPAPFEAYNKTFPTPDAQLVLIPTYSIGMERIGKRDTRDMLEGDSFQSKVYDQYRRIAQAQNLTVIDTSGPKADVFAHITHILNV